MKPYLISALFIFLAGFAASFLPRLFEVVEGKFVPLIPTNNSKVAGVQKYHLPPYNHNFPVPSISARAILVKDLDGDYVLFQKEAQTPLPIASTTKIMTALVASEYFQPNSALSVRKGHNVTGAKMGLVEGESISFRSLLYGLLLNSGNDAAFVIAENYPGGVLGFVSAMNKKALHLGLTNTSFENPAGFDHPKHYSSASDLAKITQEALQNNQLARIFSTKETEVLSLDKKHRHKLANINKLLTSLNGVLGVKTGYTIMAKENLVTLVKRDNHRILTVVLGSDDRFGETTKLVEWTYTNFSWPNY